MDDTRKERSLSALNIHQAKVEQAIQNGRSELEIAITARSRDLALEWHEEAFSPVSLDPKTGKWK